jgi:large-conductance mechanosensitive channel
MLIFLYVIRNLVGSNCIANCLFYLTKKLNQQKHSSKLKKKKKKKKKKKEIHLNKITELCLTVYGLYLYYYTTRRGCLT